MLDWLKQFVTDTASLGAPEVMLGLDNHGAQQTAAFKADCVTANVLPAYTPPDCTDVISPSDHHVGNELKRIMSIFYHEELDANRQVWCGNNSDFTRSYRRMKMATWAAAAWQVLKQRSAFLRSAFVSAGWMLAKDGSENALVEVPGVPD